ncbi:hypothetical protein CSUI_006099 [Cystoisospora suis]|uniref:Uncharacterized protein n=1 Tax=Cystoisospora suis TaxID=483139 RepID=A0A2C6KV86_9APIC|nr:hypothetical protein CSUI_006099 [Cystoisospora suis]
MSAAMFTVANVSAACASAFAELLRGTLAVLLASCTFSTNGALSGLGILLDVAGDTIEIGVPHCRAKVLSGRVSRTSGSRISSSS